MGFLKDLGQVAGQIAGVAIAAPVILVGEVVKSDYIKEIGEAAGNVTAHTGEILGSVAESTVKCASGIINNDSKKVNEGFSEVVETSAKTVVGMGKGLVKTAEKGIDTVAAIADGDTDKAIRTGKELVKIAAVSTLAVGICDVIGGLDLDHDGIPDILEDHGLFGDKDNVQLVENPNMHYVSPHNRTLPDGREIWVDGDGDTTVDTYDGWVQHNPDYRI